MHSRVKKLFFIALAGTAAAAHLAAQGGFTGPGSYEISNVRSGRVLDLDRNDQTTVIQFSPRGTDNQLWAIRPAGGGFFLIRNHMNGFALEATGGSNSTPLRCVPYTGAPNQQWRFEPRGSEAVIINRLSGKAIDVPDGSTRDGVRIQIYDFNGESNQRFVLRPTRLARTFGFERAPVAPPPSPEPLPVGRLRCESDGRRVFCDSDTSGGVRLVRQFGGNCIEGQTWGADRRGIWVDRGCRAEFELIPPRRGQLMVCESDRGHRVACDADTRGGVRLVRQLSGSCIEGQTWGWDRRGIWVDRGCKGEFEVRR